MDNYRQNPMSRNILIVDDDPDTCLILSTIFKMKGYKVTVAYSGKEALSEIETDQPDVIILDILMPEMDGWETHAQVRNRCNVPVLFLTAVGSGDSATRALQSGAYDYVRKPFCKEELLERVENLLERYRLASGPPRPTVTVIIPTLNEAENLPYVLPYLPYDMIDEVILVDGCSTDGTVEVARRLLPSIKVILEHRRGKGAALRAGFVAVTSEIIITLDGDGSTDPKEIPAFIGSLRSGADFVKGSRFVQGAGTLDMPFYRRIGNWSLVVLTNLLFRAHYTDITYGYNATWRRHICSLALDHDGWACEIISNIRAARCGLRVVEVASVERERISGEPKLRSLSAGWAILKAIVRERFMPHRPAAIANESVSKRIIVQKPNLE